MYTDLYHDLAVLLDINHVCKQFKAPLFGSFRDNPYISQFTDLTPRSLGSTIVQSTWRQCTVCFLKVRQKIWPQIWELCWMTLFFWTLFVDFHVAYNMILSGLFWCLSLYKNILHIYSYCFYISSCRTSSQFDVMVLNGLKRFCF